MHTQERVRIEDTLSKHRVSIQFETRQIAVCSCRNVAPDSFCFRRGSHPHGGLTDQNSGPKVRCTHVQTNPQRPAPALASALPIAGGQMFCSASRFVRPIECTTPVNKSIVACAHARPARRHASTSGLTLNSKTSAVHVMISKL